MSVLLHISDTHFGTEVSAVETALVALHETLLPELVVLSGDVTQRARRSQFERARRFLTRLAPRHVLVIPGNHDLPLFNLPARVTRPYDGFQRVFGPELEPVFESPELLVVTVNTTRAWRFEDGEISSAQIARVGLRLAESTARLKLVVTHQPVHVVTSRDAKNLVHNSATAVREWTAHGADLFLGGHIHLPYVRPLRERYAELTRPSWVAQAGTAVSSRVRGSIPNSVNVVRTSSEERCRVERWDFQAGAFCLKDVTVPFAD